MKALLLLALLASCTTTVVTVEPNSGYEAQTDSYIKLRLETIVADYTENNCSIKLPFEAYNSDDEYWIIKDTSFLLEHRGEALIPNRFLKADKPPESVICSIPPRSGAKFDINIKIPSERTTGKYRLYIFNGAGTNVYNLEINEFNQLSQAFRFVGFFTLMIVIL